MRLSIHKIKIWSYIIFNYVIHYKKLRKKYIDSGNKLSVYFDLKDIRQEPYYFPIIFSFHDSGYNIFIANNIKFIGHSFGPGKYIYDLPNVFIANRKNQNASIFITDSKAVFMQAENFEKKVLLSPHAFEVKDKREHFFPYPMHPNAYYKRYFEKLGNLRQQEKKSRILFSGNTEPVMYQNPVIHNRFSKLNRIEIINALIKELDPACFVAIRRKEDEEFKKTDYFIGMYLYLWQWSLKSSRGLEIRVANDQWLDFLSTGDFFICCPGIVIPQSHNAIEAMSVGTIPILQYAEYFHPSLEDGVNCITFFDAMDLIKRIKQILLMTEEEIKSMRSAVIEYYEKYLRHDVPAKLIETLPIGEYKFNFYNEAI